MERITSEDLRDVAIIFLKLGHVASAEIILRAAFTIDEMDKDIAILEAERQTEDY